MQTQACWSGLRCCTRNMTGDISPDLLAVDRPRSFWQCVENTTLSALGVLAIRSPIRPPNSCGRFHPVQGDHMAVGITVVCKLQIAAGAIFRERSSSQWGSRNICNVPSAACPAQLMWQYTFNC